MRHYLEVQNINGIDEGNSSVLTTTTYASFSKTVDPNGNITINETTKAKPSDDKIVIGYTLQGLPFLITVDGFYGGNAEHVFAFVDQCVTPLIPEYAERLTSGENPQVVSTDIIYKIYAAQTAQDKFKEPAQFTLSMAVTYPKGEKLHCAGFGIGDTGIVLKRSNGEIEQLVHSTYPEDGSKDGFDEESAKAIEYAINRNDLFNVEVAQGDELLGYTSLPKGMQARKSDSKSKYKFHIENSNVTSQQEESNTLFKIVTTSLDAFKDLDANEAKKALEASDDCEAKTGDDCAIGSVVIPKRSLQNTLKVTVASDAAEETIARVIENLSTYLEKPRQGQHSHLSWYSKRWDASLGHWRASVYQKSLLSKDLTLGQKLIIAYAILETLDGSKQLKADVIKAIGEQDLTSAKGKLNQIIHTIYQGDKPKILADINDFALPVSELANNPDPDYKIDPADHEVDISSLLHNRLKENPQQSETNNLIQPPMQKFAIDRNGKIAHNISKGLIPSRVFQSGLWGGAIVAINNMVSNDFISKSAIVTKQNESCEGKWLIEYPNGSKELDQAWEKILEAVKAGKLHNAKVTGIDDTRKFKAQTIIVYTTNYADHGHVFNVYDYLVKELSIPAKNIVGYKRDSETLSHSTQEKYWWNLKSPAESLALKDRHFNSLQENEKKTIYTSLSKQADQAENLDKVRFNLFKKELKNTYTSSWNLFKRSEMLDAIDKGEIKSIKDVKACLDSSENANKYQRSRSILSKLS